MLNKICPENVKGLAGKLKELDVESSSELERVILQIFKKALKEPHCCETYADLVFYLRAGWEKKVFKAAAKTMEEIKQDQQDGKGAGAGDKVILGTRPSYLNLDGTKREDPGSRRATEMEGFAEVRRKR